MEIDPYLRLGFPKTLFFRHSVHRFEKSTADSKKCLVDSIISTVKLTKSKVDSKNLQLIRKKCLVDSIISTVKLTKSKIDSKNLQLIRKKCLVD